MKSPIYIIKTLTTKKVIAMSSISLLLTTILNMKQMLLALAIIIIIDMLTGIRKSLHLKGVKSKIYKKEFWRAINSNGIRQTWRKTYEYSVGVIIFVILDSLVLKSSEIELMGSTYSLSQISVALACIIEIYSIYENMEAVSGRNLLKRLSFLLPQKVQRMFTGKVINEDPQDSDDYADLPLKKNY